MTLYWSVRHLTNVHPQEWKKTQTAGERFTMNFSRGPAPEFRVSSTLTHPLYVRL